MKNLEKINLLINEEEKKLKMKKPNTPKLKIFFKKNLKGIFETKIITRFKGKDIIVKDNGYHAEASIKKTFSIIAKLINRRDHKTLSFSPR